MDREKMIGIIKGHPITQTLSDDKISVMIDNLISVGFNGANSEDTINKMIDMLEEDMIDQKFYTGAHLCAEIIGRFYRGDKS